MFEYRLVVQCDNNPDAIMGAVGDLAGLAPFTRLRASFAYANPAGAQQLTECLANAMTDWHRVTKQWLISMDFGLTDPRALDLLRSLPESEVRVPDAPYLLTHRLSPRTCFHPKSILLDVGQKPGAPPVGLFVGSANMTVSGLRLADEHATLAAWTTAESASLRRGMKVAHAEAKRFASVWQRATAVDDGLLRSYEAAHARALKARRRRDEDDTSSIRQLGRTTAPGSFEAAAELARARNLWVEAHYVVPNLGKGDPGNQIDLPRGTRVFFGLGSRDVPRKSPLGDVDLHVKRSGPIALHMNFGHNGMDKLNLPRPGSPGPPTYEDQTLLFTRRTDGAFDLNVGSTADVAAWRDSSQGRGTLYAMKKGRAARAREWGLF